MAGAHEQIVDAVSAWPGVSVASHRFGGVEFRVGRVELGHIHGDVLADLPFPKKVRDEIVAGGEAQPHHVLPGSGWVSKRIHSPADVAAVIALFRRNYERVRARGEHAKGEPPTS
jgi:Family of unknown function (DUF5519)